MNAISAPLTMTVGEPGCHLDLSAAGVERQRQEKPPFSGLPSVATSPARVVGSRTPGAGVKLSGR